MDSITLRSGKVIATDAITMIDYRRLLIGCSRLALFHFAFATESIPSKRSGSFSLYADVATVYDNVSTRVTICRTSWNIEPGAPLRDIFELMVAAERELSELSAEFRRRDKLCIIKFDI